MPSQSANPVVVNLTLSLFRVSQESAYERLKLALRRSPSFWFHSQLDSLAAGLSGIVEDGEWRRWSCGASGRRTPGRAGWGRTARRRPAGTNLGKNHVVDGRGKEGGARHRTRTAKDISHLRCFHAFRLDREVGRIRTVELKEGGRAKAFGELRLEDMVVPNLENGGDARSKKTFIGIVAVVIAEATGESEAVLQLELIL